MANRNIRDTVFCRYMGTAKHLLELFNAIKGTDYTDASSIRINTLEGSFYCNIKNDISFICEGLIMLLIEHQTTINPNMPARLLSYVDELFRRYIRPQQEKIYGSRLIRLPAPEFYVFYDGGDTSFDHKILKLSDAFMTASDKLELIVNVYNLAAGRSGELKRSCRPLREYSVFSNQYKKFRKESLPVDEAVRETIRYCIQNDVMKDYLSGNEKEVIDMFGFEWNAQEEREALLKYGKELGEARGEIKGNLKTIRNIMAKNSWSAEKTMDFMGIAPSEYQTYLSFL